MYVHYLLKYIKTCCK